MSGSTGWGSGLWKDLQKVRISDGTIEAPVTADGEDGIRIGSASLTPSGKPAPRTRRRGRPRLLARLFRRRGPSGRSGHR